MNDRYDVRKGFNGRGSSLFFESALGGTLGFRFGETAFGGRTQISVAGAARSRLSRRGEPE
jgi:hypothetical protein